MPFHRTSEYLPAERTALIDGFRALADYLESNPDMPTPSCADVYTFPPAGDCRDMRAEIDAIAGLLGIQAHETAGGQHYTAAWSFGPVQYRAIAICKHAHHDTGRR
jgi:hypothetical protein